jgi:hypothetical protein
MWVVMTAAPSYPNPITSYPHYAQRGALHPHSLSLKHVCTTHQALPRRAIRGRSSEACRIVSLISHDGRASTCRSKCTYETRVASKPSREHGHLARLVNVYTKWHDWISGFLTVKQQSVSSVAIGVRVEPDDGSGSEGVLD